MRFGLQMESTGLGGDPRIFADLARDAEAAGWDGIFLSDPGYPTATSPPARWICDAWIALAAMAQATEKIRIGTNITPLPRYHPYEVAMRVSALDHLADGRVDLTVGPGHGPAFERLGLDLATRVGKLRESLDIVTKLWTGQPVTFHGEHFRYDEIVLSPSPVQRWMPLRICAWNRTSSVDLAARWGGLHWPHFHEGSVCEERGCFDMVDRLRRRLGEEAELAIEGNHVGPDVAGAARRFAAGGVTWWLEPVWRYQLSGEPDPDGLRAHIRSGPPV